jgi:phosphotransacetylase
MKRDNLQDLFLLKNKITAAQKNADKVGGQLSQIMKTLKEEYDCESLEEAEDYLIELKQEKKEKTEQLNRAIEQLKEEFNV